MRPIRLLSLTLVLVVCPAALLAQGIVSARAGLIHQSDGRVLLNEKPIVHKPSQFLEVKEQEYLRTERGRVEVLLTPGIFLRLGENSQVQMISSKLADVRLRLLAGAAVIEADELDKANAVTVMVKDAQVHLLHAGLYRLDVPADETPRLRVFAGEAMVKEEYGEYHVKAKKEIDLAANYEVRKFDPEDTDALDRWSKRRANQLAVANVSASRLAYQRGMTFAGSSWIWNPYFGMYTFLPYRNIAWSPYGYGFYSPRAVYVMYNPPRYSPPSSMGYSPPMRSYSGSSGYTSVGQTSAGTSGVVASSPHSSASQGGAASVSHGTATSGGGGRR